MRELEPWQLDRFFEIIDSIMRLESFLIELSRESPAEESTPSARIYPS
jgi:hypothetical protein